MTSPFVSHPIVELDRVSKSFGAGATLVQALQEVSLSLGPGEVVGLVGRSGSGKTTLLNVLLGWESPDSGSIGWAGRAMTPSELSWEAIGVLPQSLALIDELSVVDNVRLPQMLATPGPEGPQRLKDVLSLLGIDHLASRRPSETSLGEQQRTALARAVVLAPRVLVADEPTSHQDADHAARVFGLFRQLALEGSSCLVATHNEDAARHCHRIVEMEGGRLRAPNGGTARAR